jgi:hypothetical protein
MNEEPDASWHRSAGNPIFASALLGLRARCINGSQGPSPCTCSSPCTFSPYTSFCTATSQAGQWASPLGPGGRGRARGRRLGLALGTRRARALSLLLPGALGQKEEGQHCRHHQPNTKAHLSHMHVQRVVSLPPSRPLNRPGHSPVPPATYARGGRDGCSARLCLSSSLLFLVAA